MKLNFGFGVDIKAPKISGGGFGVDMKGPQIGGGGFGVDMKGPKIGGSIGVDLLFQSLFQISSSQDFSELVQPMCSKKQIKYTIVADMMTYLEKENNIDGRELYSSIDDLKEKKLGTFSILTIDESFKNVIQYKNYDELIIRGRGRRRF